MKKALSLLLALLIALSTAACTAGGTSDQPDPDTPANGWGITLTLENVTPAGATIVCTQSGGDPMGELNTGSYYVVQQLTKGGWESLEHLELEGELAWTDEAWIINMGGTTEWDVNWEWLYGELPSGTYRIGKEFMDFRGPGDYDEMLIYAEFDIE